MTRRAARVTQIEIKRAIQAAQDAGNRVERFEVDNSTGNVIVHLAAPNAKAVTGFRDPDSLLQS